ncbi:MAG: hypothetical protein NUW01_17990 [Gemmatimonadaceae bacterium]|nr:hypothetical protein [Gemmatimonadaceae bacterium]
MTRSFLAGFLTFALAASGAGAQGNLSTQGFGYPPGQLSTTAMSLGGGPAEVDPNSALNPAAVALWGATVMFMQYEPEVRTVKRLDVSSRTTTARFPMVGMSLTLGRRLTAQVSASTFLDRTWSSVTETQQDIGGTVVDATELFSSNGGITDFRLALGYTASPRFQIGLGGHVFSGENRITVEQRFPDTVTFSGTSQTSDISYSAFGASAGIVWRPVTSLGLGASVRVGGDMETQAGDSVLTSGKLPLRYGFGASYSGISGVALSARASFDEWSAMQPLRRAGSNMLAFDSWDYGVGADVAGPTIGRRNIALRLGARYRGLPFGAGGALGGEQSKVNELTFSGGFGIPLGIGRSRLDIGVARATRDLDAKVSVNPATETAYIFSFGVRVRP